MSGGFVRGSLGEKYTNPKLRKLNEVDLPVSQYLKKIIGTNNYAWIKQEARKEKVSMPCFLRGIIEKERLKRDGELIISDLPTQTKTNTIK